MKRILLFVIAVLLITTGLFFLFRIAHILNTSGQGALQITTNIKSNVYLDGKFLGTTPLCKCNQNDTITEGTYTVKIEPQDKNLAPFTIKATVNPGVLTAIERTFLPGSLASAYILTLEKTSEPNAQLLVTSLPSNAMVAVDGQAKSVTPYLDKNITPSEHEVEIQKVGFAKKTIRVRTVNSYTLKIDVILGTQSDDAQVIPTPLPTTSTTPSPTSTKLSPTPSTKITPTPTKTSTIPSGKASVTILDTPTGFLRVRATPGGTEIDQVSPGEKFEMLDEQNGWIQIKLSTSKNGWVSGRYVEKNN